MTSESLTSEIREPSMDGFPSTDSSDTQISVVHSTDGGVSKPPPDEADDAVFAKAQTLMMSLDDDPEESDSGPLGLELDSSPRYYVQGVVLGQRACLITNLLGGDSQTLFQPQMVWTIGRNREAALPLRDRVLSRRHAVILYVPDEGFYLIDLNSMNGSFINGQRIEQRQLLKDGDRLRIGSFEFNFFTSCGSRSIEAIHPEVLTRFTTSKTRSEAFMDYAALEEPEVIFGSGTRSQS